MSTGLEPVELNYAQVLYQHMLGVRREGVTKAAGALHRRKLIDDYSRGNIKIPRRKGLEAAACSCCRVVKDLQDLAQV